jgi:hypothetical protein
LDSTFWGEPENSRCVEILQHRDLKVTLGSITPIFCGPQTGDGRRSVSCRGTIRRRVDGSDPILCDLYASLLQ